MLTARDLASRMVNLAMHCAQLDAKQLALKSGVSYRNVLYILEGASADSAAHAQHGCRFDTLVAILAACGYELRMEKKNVETETQHRTNDGVVCGDSKDRNDFLTARRNK